MKLNVAFGRIVLGLLLVVSSMAAMAQNEKSGLRKEMETYYSKMDSMVMKAELNPFFALFDSNYYVSDLDGKRMNLAEFKQMIKGMVNNPGMKLVSHKSNIKNVQLQNQEAVVWIENVVTWKEKSGNGWATKKMTTRWAENLVSSSGSWKIKSSQQLMTNEPWSFKTND